MQRQDDLSAFVEARWPRLVRSAVLMGCSDSQAEDAVQDTLLRCLTHWKKVNAAHDIDAYVHRILINTINSRRRRRWNSERPAETTPDMKVEDAASVFDDVDLMTGALNRLSVDHRTVLVLRYYSDLSETQMVEVLGISAGTVKSRLSRALRALRSDPGLIEGVSS